MCTSSCTLVLCPVIYFLCPIDIVLEHLTWYCQRRYNSRKKMMLLIIFRFLLLLASNHTERGRCHTLGSRDIYGLIPLCRTNCRVSLEYSQCLVKSYRWCHRLPSSKEAHLTKKRLAILLTHFAQLTRQLTTLVKVYRDALVAPKAISQVEQTRIVKTTAYPTPSLSPSQIRDKASTTSQLTIIITRFTA